MMKDQTLLTITPAEFRRLFPDAPNLGLGDDFYVLDATLKEYHDPVNRSCRLDGFMIFYCVKGDMKMNVNLTEINLKEGMVYVNVPGNIIRINEIVSTSSSENRYICMVLSKEFFHELNIEVCKLFNEGLLMIENPGMKLCQRDFELTGSLMHYIISLLRSDVSYKREAVLSAISSLFYILMGTWTTRVAEPNNLSNRSKMIFDKFVRLVMEHYRHHRNVSFYAEKLCLTPKYLSKLIKNATGRSAPEWIDSYVILEAKNLLKNSDISIKELVFMLHFPNQSVFYKFFKAHTGMTPTEYRNS